MLYIYSWLISLLQIVVHSSTILTQHYAYVHICRGMAVSARFPQGPARICRCPRWLEQVCVLVRNQYDTKWTPASLALSLSWVAWWHYIVHVESNCLHYIYYYYPTMLLCYYITIIRLCVALHGIKLLCTLRILHQHTIPNLFYSLYYIRCSILAVVFSSLFCLLSALAISICIAYREVPYCLVYSVYVKQKYR